MHIFHKWTKWEFINDSSSFVSRTCQKCGKLQHSTIGRLRMYN